MDDWAVILGASSGIGAECARALAEKGINIYGIYLRKKKSEIEKIKNNFKKYNVQAIFKKANASNEDMRKEIIQELSDFKDIRIKFFILAFIYFFPFSPPNWS